MLIVVILGSLPLAKGLWFQMKDSCPFKSWERSFLDANSLFFSQRNVWLCACLLFISDLCSLWLHIWFSSQNMAGYVNFYMYLIHVRLMFTVVPYFIITLKYGKLLLSLVFDTFFLSCGGVGSHDWLPYVLRGVLGVLEDPEGPVRCWRDSWGIIWLFRDLYVARRPVSSDIIFLGHNVSFWAKTLTHNVSFWIRKVL